MTHEAALPTVSGKKLDLHDLLQRKEFAEKLEAFLQVEKDFVDEGLVVALNASFGSGKTQFLEMWQKRLRNPDELFQISGFNPITLYLNAWKSDFLTTAFLPFYTSLEMP